MGGPGVDLDGVREHEKKAEKTRLVRRSLGEGWSGGPIGLSASARGEGGKPDPTLYRAGQSDVIERARADFDAGRYAQAARALEDGIVSEPGAVDLAMITGTGFPPFRGGLLRYADALGLPKIVEKLEAYERALGVRFQPAPLLRAHAEAGRGFYG